MGAPVTSTPEKLQRAVEIVTERSTVLLEALKLQMGPDGEVYGMLELEGAEFIAAFLDAQDHTVVLEPIDPENPDMSMQGRLIQRLLPNFIIFPNQPPPPPIVLEHVNALEHLSLIAPRYFSKLETQFRREYAKLAEQVA